MSTLDGGILGGSTLDGKAVVVTGAGRGLGAAFAAHLAGAGAAVVVNDVDHEAARRVAADIRADGGAVVASGHSVADPEQAEAIVDLCAREFGAVDGLVNNAGLNHEALPWDDDPARVRALVEVNVLGVLYTGMAAIRRMRAAGRGGAIVNISSGASLGQRTLGAYAASKGAVSSLTYSWALDLEECGIRVNAVCPLAYTRMVWTSERASRVTGPDSTPDLVAPLVHFLLDDRSAGITGQVVRCTGTELHVVGRPHFKAPILRRDEWDLDSVDRAFTEVLGGHLEPYGLEQRLPPRLRKWLTPA
ncbi:3-oxoacyl-[acyl-carrier protein] reductase [Actinokineospora spheciospongiae]|uniref:3-oxoacyl-[acyl-carrier protein] reductase n=1 Tax=Actinokineospora spheciospongiae TaxID=909613 RepID=W7J463_9PSEU|nr:SDR family NAD(P)-dependent oxidoreductase [Actinokineospora spheciospongiae]EWC63802.1 3-oxoacyl-[acyl-carrier protein] reductase [Actinokineospora spheciospongiae]